MCPPKCRFDRSAVATSTSENGRSWIQSRENFQYTSALSVGIYWCLKFKRDLCPVTSQVALCHSWGYHSPPAMANMMRMQLVLGRKRLVTHIVVLLLANEDFTTAVRGWKLNEYNDSPKKDPAPGLVASHHGNGITYNVETQDEMTCHMRRLLQNSDPVLKFFMIDWGITTSNKPPCLTGNSFTHGLSKGSNATLMRFASKFCDTETSSSNHSLIPNTQ